MSEAFATMLQSRILLTAESLSTLKFANRAKSIKNAARLNEDVDQRTLLRKYERELKRLRAELLARQASLVDARRLLQVKRECFLKCEVTSLMSESDELLARQASLVGAPIC